MSPARRVVLLAVLGGLTACSAGVRRPATAPDAASPSPSPNAAAALIVPWDLGPDWRWDDEAEALIGVWPCDGVMVAAGAVVVARTAMYHERAPEGIWVTEQVHRLPPGAGPGFRDELARAAAECERRGPAAGPGCLTDHRAGRDADLFTYRCPYPEGGVVQAVVRRDDLVAAARLSVGEAALDDADADELARLVARAFDRLLRQ